MEIQNFVSLQTKNFVSLQIKLYLIATYINGMGTTGKYQNKYRITTARRPGWDYGSNALYYVTINTKNRVHYFGKIVDKEMHLTNIGRAASDCWQEIPEHFSFVILIKFVVMPDHVHGILRINKPPGMDVEETQYFVSLPFQKNKFGPQSNNLASVLRGYKIGVTNFAKSNNILFCWQRGYHDHIIRDDRSFFAISKYIENNPGKWDIGK